MPVFPLSMPDACVQYYPGFIAPAQAWQHFQTLQQLAWRQDSLRLYGKQIAIPRLQAWYGDDCLQYRYSGLTLTALPWTPLLLEFRRQLSDLCQYPFNAVLANWYRDQHDSVAWHSDDEAELGPQPVIASLSFGGEREFKFKHKYSGEKRAISLKSGDLLVMSGETQQYWQHAILRSRQVRAPRINLTFRAIRPDAAFSNQ